MPSEHNSNQNNPTSRRTVAPGLREESIQRLRADPPTQNLAANSLDACRVPELNDLPEKIVASIDPSLRYISELPGGDASISNTLYLVTDGTQELVLKVCGAAGRLDKSFQEQRALQHLNNRNVEGIPKLLKVYNPFDGTTYTPEKFTALLREYPKGILLDQQTFTSDVYQRVIRLCRDLLDAGISLPLDFNGSQFVVTEHNAVFLFDLEETSVIDPVHVFDNPEEELKIVDLVARHYNYAAKEQVLQRLGGGSSWDYSTLGHIRADTANLIADTVKPAWLSRWSFRLQYMQIGNLYIACRNRLLSQTREVIEGYLLMR